MCPSVTASWWKPSLMAAPALRLGASFSTGSWMCLNMGSEKSIHQMDTDTKDSRMPRWPGSPSPNMLPGFMIITMLTTSSMPPPM